MACCYGVVTYMYVSKVLYAICNCPHFPFSTVSMRISSWLEWLCVCMYVYECIVCGCGIAYMLYTVYTESVCSVWQ